MSEEIKVEETKVEEKVETKVVSSKDELVVLGISLLPLQDASNKTIPNTEIDFFI